MKFAQLLILAIAFTFISIGCSKKEEGTVQHPSEQENTLLSSLKEVSDGEASLAALNVLKARAQEKDGELFNVVDDCEKQIREAENESIESAKTLEWQNARAFCAGYAKEFCRNPSPGSALYNKCEIFKRVRQS